MRAFALHILLALCGCFAVTLGAADVSGIISSNTVWAPARNPYVVSSEITIATNAVLTIEAGVVVQLDPTGALIAQAGGAFDVQGTSTKPVLFRPNGTNSWLGIGAIGTNAAVTLRHARVEGGPLLVAAGASGFFEFCQISNYPLPNEQTPAIQPIVVAEESQSLIIRACHFRNFYETHFRNGVFVIEDSLFEEVAGDAIDFDSAAAGSVIRRCTLRGGNHENSDAVDIGTLSAGVRVESCLIYNFPFDKGVSVGELSTNVVIQSCVIHNVETGVAIKDGSQATITNNTIFNSNHGLRLYETIAGFGGGHVAARNNIIWKSTNAITLLNEAFIAVSYSDISGVGTYPGLANLNVDPGFRNLSVGDFRLSQASLVARAGEDGGAIGAWFPVGSYLVDSDGDAMPDTWEMAFDFDYHDASDAFADSDQDGSTNLEEFRAGTNPRQPPTALAVTIRRDSNGALTLHFPALANRTYTVESRDSFNLGVWQKVTETGPAPDDHTLVWPIPLSGTSRFFRVVAR